jgi:hypothetical protein
MWSKSQIVERKIITINDFQNVARNNEYFLWHFLQKNQEESNLGFYSYFAERKNDNHILKEILDLVKIPYFESYVEDSLDFLNGFGVPYERLWSPPNTLEVIPSCQFFSPSIIGFKKFSKISSTLESCYCVEGLLDIITDLNPKLLLSINTED